MQIETDELINKNLNNCKKLDNSGNSNMCDSNSRQNPTRSHKETCMLAKKNLTCYTQQTF